MEYRTSVTTDHLDRLKVADHAWRAAKAEADEAAERRHATVKEAREAGHSLKQIAELLDVSIATVSDMARGRGPRRKEARRAKI